MKTPTLYAPDWIRGITIKQPWAGWIVAGLKDVENRTWRARHRGRLYIPVL